MNGPSVSASAGRTRWALCSQIGRVLRELLVDLLGERLADGRVGRLVAHVAHVEVEAGLGGLRVDRRGRRDEQRVDDAAEAHDAHARAVGQRVDAPVDHAAGRREVLRATS